MSNQDKKIVKEAAPQKESIIVNKVVIRPVDRSPRDIQSIRTAHRQAEAIIYANRVRLYDLYDDILLDGHLTGITRKRVSSVRNKKLHFTKDGKRVEEMNDLIKSKPFRDLITQIMDSIYWGLSGVEFMPGKEFKWEPIPRKHIRPDLKVITIEQYDQDGIPYESNPWVWVIGDKNDLGILLKCSFYALYKRGDVADWAQYIEIFGQPVRIAKYDAYDNKTKIELEEVLDESGSSLAIMIPKQADFEMLDGKGSNGDGQLQERFKEAMNQEMSVIVLGVTETTTSSKSSGYAQSETHQDQQKELTADDMAFVENMLNEPSFLNVLASYGYPVEGGRFEFEPDVNYGQLRMRKEIDDFVAGKVPVGDDYWYETYGVPKPDNYEDLKAQMEEAAVLSRAAKLMSNQKKALYGQGPVNAAPALKGKGKKKGAEGSKDIPDQSDSGLSKFDRMRLAVADFFAHALKA